MPIIINSYLDNNEKSMDESIRSFMGTAYLWNRGNFAWYLFRSFIGMVLPGDSPSDWGVVSYLLANRNMTLAYLIMGGMVGLEVWDLYNSRDEIVKNYDRILGRYPSSSAGNASTGFQIMPYGKGFVLAWQTTL